MKILIGDKDNVDLDRPIKMSVESKNKFLTFLRANFLFVNEMESSYHRTDRLGDKSFSSRWNDEELALLYNPRKSNEEIAEGLGITWLSIANKRGQAIAEFQIWARGLGKGYVTIPTEKEIQGFIKYRARQKEIEKKLKSIPKELEKLGKEIGNIDNQLSKIGSIVGFEERIKLLKSERDKFLKRKEELEKELEEINKEKEG
jgi:hypothetical protein